MKSTVEVSDDLYRRAKVEAALSDEERPLNNDFGGSMPLPIVIQANIAHRCPIALRKLRWLKRRRH